MQRLALLSLLLLTSPLLLACATVHRAELPEISIVDLKLADMTLFETTAEFTVRITNGDPAPLNLDGGSVLVYLSDVKVGRGLLSEPIQVPGLGTTTLTLPVYINHLSVATRLRSILESKQLPYRVEGVLFREPTLGLRRKIRTRHEGLFDFQAPAPARESEPISGLDGDQARPVQLVGRWAAVPGAVPKPELEVVTVGSDLDGRPSELLGH